MKSLFLLLVLAFISMSAKSSEYKILRVESLEYETRLYLDNGEIVKVLNLEIESIKNAMQAYKTGSLVSFVKKEVTTETQDIISQLVITEKVELPPLKEEIEEEASVNKEMYTPAGYNALRFYSHDPLEKSNITQLSSYEDAQSVMNLFNGETREKSQCYNRAHMWTYEALYKSQVNLGKVWIFFTSKYINEYNYKWWFHVAPYTEVHNEAKYILDRGFTMIPYNFENWKNIFMKNKAHCPVVKSYNEYQYGKWKEYCYIIFSSQYYWQPWQLENLANRNIHYWGYKMGELEIAYKDALIYWNRKIPRLTYTPSQPLPPREREEDRYSTPRREEPGRTYNPSYNGFSVGLRVIDQFNEIGSVTEIYNNGRVRVHFDLGSKLIRSTRNLSKKTRCYRNICQGQKVMDSFNSNQKAWVTEIFENGMALVIYEGMATGVVVPSSRLSR